MRWMQCAAALALVLFVGLAAGVAMAAEDTGAADAKEGDTPKEGEAPKEGEKGFFGKLKDDIVEGAESVKQEAAAAVPDVPSGAVVAFNRDKCPVGWSEFPPAAGRVIRGTGDSGDGKPVHSMQIGETEKADTASRNADEGDYVRAGVPWLGLLICEKD